MQKKFEERQQAWLKHAETRDFRMVCTAACHCCIVFFFFFSCCYAPDVGEATAPLTMVVTTQQQQRGMAKHRL
jgi:hypothetical protein